MSEWQPIDTAPRDGTEILAYWTNMGSFFVANYNKGLCEWESDGFTMNPTHWMPLPEPPKAA